MANAKSKTADMSAEDLSDQIETLRNDLSALTQTIADIGKAKGEETVATAKAKMSEAREKASDTAEHARVRAEDFMQTQPATALGIAAGIGFLIGFLGSRK